MDLKPYRDFMTELALKSGDFIRPYFASPTLLVETKEDQTPVTVADRGAEALMRSLIEKKFPNDSILGEEYGVKKGTSDFTWILDPIDGTKSFASACPLFGTLIALAYQGTPILGCINQPVLNQLLIGDGSSTELNGRSVKIRSCKEISSATLLTSDPLNPGKYQNGKAYETLANCVKLTRTWGDCYGYLLLATGWADIMCDPIMNPWDIQALIPIVKGAGGTITDWQGKDPINGSSIVATGKELHPQIIAALNKA